MGNNPSYLPITDITAPRDITFGGTAVTPSGQFLVVSFVPIPPKTTGYGVRVYEISGDSLVQRGSDIPVGSPSFENGYVQ